MFGYARCSCSCSGIAPEVFSRYRHLVYRLHAVHTLYIIASAQSTLALDRRWIQSIFLSQKCLRIIRKTVTEDGGNYGAGRILVGAEVCAYRLDRGGGGEQQDVPNLHRVTSTTKPLKEKCWSCSNCLPIHSVPRCTHYTYTPQLRVLYFILFMGIETGRTERISEGVGESFSVR